MSKERILVIEDEEDILALVHYNLVKAGHKSTAPPAVKMVFKKPAATSPTWSCST